MVSNTEKKFIKTEVKSDIKCMNYLVIQNILC